MTANATLAPPDVEPPILERIRASQRAARSSFRLKFIITWALILGVLGAAIVATGNANPDSRSPGRPTSSPAPTTIHVSVVSIFLATILAVIGALGRLSANWFLNSSATLYVSLVRGTPLLVQIYFVFFALPQMGTCSIRSQGSRHLRAHLQLRRLHDRDLPSRYPGGPPRPA